LFKHEVRIEVGLTDTQRQFLEAMRDDFIVKIKQGAEIDRAFDDLMRWAPDEDPRQAAIEQARLREARVAARREQLEPNGDRVAAVLTDAQRKRLTQLWLQNQGVDALQDAGVIESLNLTDEQQERIRAASTPTEAREPAGEKEGLAKALDALTDKQRAKFDEMRGEAFEFAEQRTTGGVAGRGGQAHAPQEPPAPQTPPAEQPIWRLVLNGIEDRGLLWKDEVQAELKLTGEQKARYRDTFAAPPRQLASTRKTSRNCRSARCCGTRGQSRRIDCWKNAPPLCARKVSVWPRC
jgi:hypothetical protein